ncbi:hypothetical protein GGH20_001054 [Coemansia sp. RSA 1937]|nr:hypothetical protein GGH20_001054 [Coemansia sp. RSA 1937]
MNTCTVFFVIYAAAAVIINAAAIPTRPTLHIFGDSVSDNGLLKNITNGKLPVWPYWEGRFSSGPVWNEYMAPLLGYELNNMAIAGSIPDNGYLELPGSTTLDSANTTDSSGNTIKPTMQPNIETQINNYNLSLAGHVLPAANYNDIVILQTGAAGFLFKAFSILANEITINDFVDYLSNSAVKQLDQLYRLGFKTIILVDIPDFQYSPAAELFNITDLYRTTVDLYNKQVASMASEWAAKSDQSIFGIIELGKFVEVTIKSQAITDALGLLDSTTACVGKKYVDMFVDGETPDFENMPKNVTDSLVCSSPSTNYFFDYFHLGERVHRLLGYYSSEYAKALQSGKSFELDENTLLELVHRYNLGTNVSKPVNV